ncbi:MAG: hypothetical protein J0L52_07025 [Caulobacterales bacterium]|nr:hypothetical protein [Caulobacterales bacterium]
MRLTALVVGVGLTLGLAACQPSGDDSDVAFTSGPPIGAEAASEAGTDAAQTDAASAAQSEAEPTQQSVPAASDTGDMGDARPSDESVEPDSPTMFH